MKKILALILCLALLLPLCACGKKQKENAPADAEEQASAAQETSAPLWTAARRYRSQEITPENWTKYFELVELPLYIITSSEVISEVCQNYCVTLREEYVPLLDPDGDYSVNFSFRFDLYIDTLKIDTTQYSYQHTDDLLFASSTTKTAVFNRSALRRSAFGTDYNRYVGYGNAFFSGWATVQPESKVWAGFYIDLNAVQLVDVSGYIQIAE